MILESLAGIGAVAGGTLFAKLRTGIATMDRLGCRGLVCTYLPLVFWRDLKSPAKIVQLGRAYMAILANESRGDPRHTLGDAELSGGPSIGITQVYRTTALELGLFCDPTPGEKGDEAERAAYAKLKDREGYAIFAGLTVFASKLDQVRRSGCDAGWDEVWSAVRRYNGAGPRAEGYRQKAADFATRTWGKLP